MNDPKNFLERWSRRKRETQDESVPAPAAAQEQKPTPAKDLDPNAAVPAEAAESKTGADKPFNLADLPSIESIGANTDIRAFLQAGVPPELKRAALRHAWSADPAIRDFIGLVENGWDFNDPKGITGFGPLEAGEHIARMLSQVMGGPAPESDPQPTEPADEPTEVAALPSEPPAPAESSDEIPCEIAAPRAQIESDEEQLMQGNKGDTAPQNKIEDTEDAKGNPLALRRRQGGALPK